MNRKNWNMGEKGEDRRIVWWRKRIERKEKRKQKVNWIERTEGFGKWRKNKSTRREKERDREKNNLMKRKKRKRKRNSM